MIEILKIDVKPLSSSEIHQSPGAQGSGVELMCLSFEYEELSDEVWTRIWFNK